MKKIQLMQNESLAYVATPSLFPIWIPSVLAIIAAACLLLNGVLSMLSLVFGLLAIAFWARLFYTSTYTKLFITNKRIYYKEGHFSEVKEHYLKKIDGVHVRKGLWGSMFNFGDVALVISGVPQPWMKKLKMPEFIRTTIFEASHPNMPQEESTAVMPSVHHDSVVIKRVDAV